LRQSCVYDGSQSREEPCTSRDLRPISHSVGAAMDPYLLYPGSTREVAPSGTYNVWSGAGFGSSNATDYKTNFTRTLSWCPAKCY
jgi:hypothetical protein